MILGKKNQYFRQKCVSMQSMLDLYSSQKSKEIIFAILIIPTSQNLQNLCLHINLEKQREEIILLI